MPLEAQLAALLVAIDANTIALRAVARGDTPNPAAATNKQQAKPAEQANPAAVAPAPAAAPAAPAACVTYDDLAKVFLSLVASRKDGRDVALAAIAPLPALNKLKDDKGVPHEQHPGQYAELLAKLNAAVNTPEAVAA